MRVVSVNVAASQMTLALADDSAVASGRILNPKVFPVSTNSCLWALKVTELRPFSAS